MKRVVFMVLVLLSGLFCTRAADDTLSLPELMQGAQQWAQDNLDTNVLNALPEVDDQKVKQFYLEMQQRFQGDYVVDVAALRQAAQPILPLLQSREDTQPYAAWLKAQMYYLEVADEIRLTIPPPNVKTNQPPPVPNPPPQAERELWVKKVAGRPWPAGAKEYVPRLKPIFAAQTIPPELVWLAEVESSFDRRAQSPAGAAGFFLMVPGTAQRLGLFPLPREPPVSNPTSAMASQRHLKKIHHKIHQQRSMDRRVEHT